MYWLADRFICLWSAPAILCQSSRQTNPRTKYSTHSLSIHYAFRQSTRLNSGDQNLPILLKVTHNGWSGTVVSPASCFPNVWGQFPNCFRLISSWKNEVVYTCVSLISLLKAKGLVGETTGLPPTCPCNFILTCNFIWFTFLRSSDFCGYHFIWRRKYSYWGRGENGTFVSFLFLLEPPSFSCW